MAERFRFMPLGLVRLRTFRLSGYIGATLTQVFMRASERSGRVTQRCHNSPRWETGLQSANDVTHRKRAEDLGNLKKVSRVETRHRTRRIDFRLLAEALGRCRTRWGGEMKKPELKECVSLSLCRRTFKLKGNKKFRTWTEKSLRVFRVSRFLCSMLYIYEHYVQPSAREYMCIE